MNLKIKALTLALICTCIVFVSAQNTSNYIYGNPTFVLTMNPEIMDTKVDLDKLLQMDFFESFLGGLSKGIENETEESVSEALKTPSQYGMDFKSSSYLYADITSNSSFFTYVFTLTDGDKFTDFFNQYLKSEDIEINFINGFKTVSFSKDSYLLWNDEVAMLTNGEVEYDLTEFTDEEFLRADSLREAGITNHINELAYQAINSSDEKRFLNHNSQSDMHMWLDYGYISSLSETMSPEMMKEIPYGMGGMVESLLSMYDDTYISMAMNFDDGAINIDNQTFVNNQIRQLWKNAMDTEINKKFSKYIKGDNLLGLFSFAYSVENTAESLKNMLYTEFNKSDDGGVMTSMMDILSIAIDEEALYDLFKGDLLFAVTGMRVFEKEITTYEYDEDFNRLEVQKMVAQELPEFTMMMSYGNEDDVKKIIRLGEKSSLIKNVGTHYAMEIPGVPMDLYIALHKGILFFSNDTDLIRNRLSSGIARKKRMSKKQCTMLKENAQVFLWNIPETLDLFTGLEQSLGFTGDQMLKMTKSTFENFEMTSSKEVGNTLNTRISLNLRNKDLNALEELFNYFNDLYIVEMGGRKM